MRKLKVYLASPPGLAARASALSPVSLMGYRIGRGFHLYRTALPYVACELMDIDCTGFTGYGPHDLLTGEIMRECLGRGYSGIVMECVSKSTVALRAFFSLIASECEKYGITIYLSPHFAEAIPFSKAIIPATCTDGTFANMLKKNIESFGAHRISLYIDCTYNEYPLPSSGHGTLLSESQFNAVKNRYSSTLRFSDELCSNYLTYKYSGRTRMVLWDDKKSVSAKLDVSEGLGIGSVFLCYPQVSNFIEEIL